MDVRNILRDLVTNKELSAYMNYEFSFRTVFYHSSVAYCMCTCGFEHEFLDYVSMSGEINEEMFEKIIQCIIDGECPHVQNVNQEYIKETGVVGRYIAAAIGNKHADVDSIQRFRDQHVEGKLFELYPHMIAILKDNYIISDLPNLTTINSDILIPRRLDFSKIQFYSCSALEVCVKQKNIPLLEHIMRVSTHELENAFHHALKNNLQTIQETILTFPVRAEKKCEDLEIILACCMLAVVYDKCLLLHGLLERFLKIHIANKSFNKYVSECKDALIQTALFLQRNECIQILSSKGFSLTKEIPKSDQVHLLMSLLHEFYDVLKDEVTPLLNAISNVADILNSRTMSDDMSPLQAYVQDSLPNPNCLKLFLDLGANVVTTPVSQRNSLLICLISEVDIFSPGHRAAAELLMFENPELDIHLHPVTSHAIELDSESWRHNKRHLPLAGDFLMDAQTYGLFGYDEDDNFALNFMAPLLIECGFPIPDDIICSIESWESKLHPAEFDYFQRCSNTPKLLKHCCRDTLRKHFKGRLIHKFVEKAEIPGSIRDFILLKPLLRYVEKHLLSY